MLERGVAAASEREETQKALDEALLFKLGVFSAAANRNGIHATVHARPRLSDWMRDRRSFPAMAIISIAVIASALLGSLSEAPKSEGRSVRGVVHIQEYPAQATPEGVVTGASPGWKGSKFDQIREEFNYVNVKIGSTNYQVLDASSRISLAKTVANELKLEEKGLTWRDLYGLIHAETGWISRPGIGNNKVVSLGLAQFEPDTAKSIGLDDPEDPVQAVYGAGVLMGMAADWSSARVKRKASRLRKSEVNAAFKEGVSIYYNTSSSLRRKWNVRNTHEFPEATLHHIRNTKEGALVAHRMEQMVLAGDAYQLHSLAPSSEARLASQQISTQQYRPSAY
jgi:hypothetical protein